MTPEQRAEHARITGLYQRAMRAATEYFEHGTLSDEGFVLVLARTMLEAQGVENPSPEQVQAKAKDMEVAYSWMAGGAPG